MLNMTPTRHVDSPLRRSTISVRTSLLAAPIPIVNDDEAERRESRVLAKELDTSTVAVLQHNEGLKNCLKIFHENKISKDNAWTMSLIDNFSALIAKHHKSLNNFQVVGSTLEASSKIYGLRVDSVHTDVMRMSSGLMQKRHANRNDDSITENDDGNSAANTTQTGGGTGTENEEQSRAKRKRTRKVASTVVKNKETINAKLETYSFTDPLFAKLNSGIGDLNRSDRLLQNVLQTIDSELCLNMNRKFWDSSEPKPTEFMDEYEYGDEPIISMKTKLEISKTDVLRPQYTGYKILDTPAEEDSKDDSLAEKSFDQSHLDVAFDMDAEIEPTNEVDHFIDVPMEQTEFDNMTVADQNAIHACRTLRRKPVVLEDLRPVDSSQLEYSYRPLNEFNQFWAGPSHWKFRKYSGAHVARRSKIDQQTKHSTRTKTLKNKIEPVQFVEANVPEELSPKITSMILLKSKAAEKVKRMNSYRKWDSKKLKLPTNMQFDRNFFNFYTYALSLAMDENEPESTPAINETGYNYDNADDREYCSNNNVPDNDDDTNDDRSTCPTESADIPLTQDPQPDETAVEIPTHFAGAPERVAKIVVPFAKTAKVIDMKQLKKCTINLILKQCSVTAARSSLAPAAVAPVLSPNKNTNHDDETYEPGFASFSKIYEKLPYLLSKNMAEALSPSVAYYAILHLCNDHLLRLTVDEKEGFLIRKIKEA